MYNIKSLEKVVGSLVRQRPRKGPAGMGAVDHGPTNQQLKKEPKEELPNQKNLSQPQKKNLKKHSRN